MSQTYTHMIGGGGGGEGGSEVCLLSDWEVGRPFFGFEILLLGTFLG